MEKFWETRGRPGLCRVPLFTSLDQTFIAGSYRHQYCTTKAHRAVIFAIEQLSCHFRARTHRHRHTDS